MRRSTEDNAILEATARLCESLKHETHAAVLRPLRAKVAKLWKAFFRRQRNAVLRTVAQPLRNELAKAETREADAPVRRGGQRFAKSVLPDSLQPLKFGLTNAQATSYGAAIEEAILQAGLTLAAELRSEASLGQSVVSEYLRENSLSKLTGGINETTTQALRDSLAADYEAVATYGEIVQGIRDVYAGFQETRADMIAQTELNDAYNQGRLAMANDLDMDEKAWDADGTEACEDICQPNVDQDWIPIDDDFDSGDDAPPAHPNCDCGISFRKGSQAT